MVQDGLTVNTARVPFFLPRKGKGKSQRQDHRRITLRLGLGRLAGRIVRGNLGQRGNLALVRNNVRPVVKVVRGHPVHVARPDGIRTQVGNAQRVADNEARGVAGQSTLNACKPARHGWAGRHLAAQGRTLHQVRLGIRGTEQRTDVVNVGQELLHLQSSQGVLRVQLGKLAGVDENGVGLRNLLVVDLQHGHLAVLEVACRCGQ